MGWDGHFLSDTSTRGRKKYLDDKYTYESDTRIVSVVKSAMVGTTYYAALRVYDKQTDTEIITCDVVLTRSADWPQVMFKHMGESCGPCYYDCPASILALLTPTDSEWANEWRRKCIEARKAKNAKRKDPRALNNLPLGSVVTFASRHSYTSGINKGDKVTLTKTFSRGKGVWIDNLGYRWTNKVLPDSYVVCRKGVA